MAYYQCVIQFSRSPSLISRYHLGCHVDGLSQREAASRFGIARETVRKMLRHSEPPGYRRRQPPKRPKLAPFTDIIDRILEEDRTVHRKQHHTAKRIFERLRDEHGFTGKETIVKDYVRERRLRRREMFVPLSHPPGHAQADFGEADAIIAGVKYRAHFFVMTLPHSDACFVAAYPAAATEAWLDGHNRAFVFFGGVPQSILYDNDKCLVSRILSDGTRQRTRAFSGLQSHYLFEDRYGRPGNQPGEWPITPPRLHATKPHITGSSTVVSRQWYCRRSRSLRFIWRHYHLDGAAFSSRQRAQSER